MRWATGRLASAAAPIALVSIALGLPAQAGPKPDGFWKCRERPDIKGEFGGEDPVGLASGKHIATNCAIHARIDRKIYCFSSLPSLSFADTDRELLAKAAAFWARERAPAPSSRDHYK